MLPIHSGLQGHAGICGRIGDYEHVEYTPTPQLFEFLTGGEPPIYIGLGATEISDADKTRETMLEAVRRLGLRAVISNGKSRLGSRVSNCPSNVLFIDEVPHDWLFPQVSCVVHHGGAGTTEAALAHGKPSVILPFRGDQFYWGEAVSRMGAAPEPIPGKSVTADSLTTAILRALGPEISQEATRWRDEMVANNGTEKVIRAFITGIDAEALRCSLIPSRVAVWKVKSLDMQLSATAIGVLRKDGLVKPKDIEL